MPLLPTSTHLRDLQRAFQAAWAGKIPPLAVKGSATGAYNVVPVNDERSVVLSWVVPYTSAENRRRRIDCKPSLIVGALLGGESKGSLLSYLKDEKEWVTSLGAAVIDENADFEVFACALDLTSEGLKRKEEVIESVFRSAPRSRTTRAHTQHELARAFTRHTHAHTHFLWLFPSPPPSLPHACAS